jgi:hypothetical protein
MSRKKNIRRRRDFARPWLSGGAVKRDIRATRSLEEHLGNSRALPETLGSAIVIDAGIFITHYCIKNGIGEGGVRASFQLVESFLKGDFRSLGFRVFNSQGGLNHIQKVLVERRRVNKQAVGDHIDQIARPSTLVIPRRISETLQEPRMIVFGTVFAAGARLLVAEDRRLLDKNGFSGVSVVHPATLLSHLTSQVKKVVVADTSPPEERRLA